MAARGSLYETVFEWLNERVSRLPRRATPILLAERTCENGIHVRGAPPSGLAVAPAAAPQRKGAARRGA
eukprot:722171-Alexandrium_andersonii.AAC.1